LAEFVTRSCLSCGKELRINSNFNGFVCGHCGCEHIIKREYGTISLVPVVKEILRDGQCHICKRDGRYGFGPSFDNANPSLPETHRCQICHFWVCHNCLSPTDGGWVCSRCKP
jgi:hypothetical protein